MESCILKPVYTGMAYQYHQCSECGGKLVLRQTVFNQLQFEDEIFKFCPHCAAEIVRYDDKPTYTVEPDFNWMEEYRSMFYSFEKELKKKLFVGMTEKERRKINALAEFGLEYFGKQGYYPFSNGRLCEFIKYLSELKMNHWEIKKLM